jgi:hypothetical protein
MMVGGGNASTGQKEEKPKKAPKGKLKESGASLASLSKAVANPGRKGAPHAAPVAHAAVPARRQTAEEMFPLD